ncbi:uncharacterized protein N0V89_004658 [Didymosphaeria variabile]|uniref:Uncharacterized protein n=1 Tax=Didymosphaeria variabile TaxID=1932322 RepID=A0A9W9CDM1_9PLEO|nr:uncharacterized protein N0V89_004658 [Didymosphaeria variabile]KAJ4356622.1 hypothetical protein N0V89_004658 [Didymosphaeria variabile]
MRSFRQLALLGLPLLGGVVANEPASPSPTKGQAQNAVQAIYANANEAFQDLLNALPEESLHVALNSLHHYREGVFESNKRGVEHIHQDNPPLATKLIVAAVNDLKKRQAPASNNGTAPTTQSEQPQSTDTPQSTQAPSESSQAPPESSQASESSQDQPQSTGAPESSNAPASQSSAAPPESSAVVIPVSVTTTDSDGRTTVATSEILSRPTASIAVPVTRTNSQGSTEVATETKPAVVFSTTDSAGQAIVTTSAVDFAPTKGQVLTTTNAEGSTFLTTYTPGSGRVSSIVLLTTTGADGQQSVVTSYTYVDPAAQATEGSSDEPGSTAKPSLQKGAAAAGYRVVDAAVLGGAALAWFI